MTPTAAPPTSPLFESIVAARRRPDPDGRPPTEAELACLLRAATTVPDHGALRPWRFVSITGAARTLLGDALASDCAAARPDAPAAQIDMARRKAFAAPALIVLIASPRVGSKVPEWEQLASAACCGYAIVLAAGALDLGAVWKSTLFRDGPALRQLLSMTDAEQLLGWVNVGSPDHTFDTDHTSDTGRRSLPDLPGLVTLLDPELPSERNGF